MLLHGARGVVHGRQRIDIFRVPAAVFELALDADLVRGAVKYSRDVLVVIRLLDIPPHDLEQLCVRVAQLTHMSGDVTAQVRLAAAALHALEYHAHVGQQLRRQQHKHDRRAETFQQCAKVSVRVPSADHRDRVRDQKRQREEYPSVLAEHTGEQPRKREHHRIKRRAAVRDVHGDAHDRADGGAGQHPALHGRGHYQQQRRPAADRHEAEQLYPPHRYQHAGGGDEQRGAVAQLIRLAPARRGRERLAEKVAAAEGERGLKHELRREGYLVGLCREAAQKSGQRHDQPCNRRHEQTAFIKFQLLKHKAYSVHQHGSGDVAYPPVDAAAQQISQRRPREREHALYARPRGSHKGHTERRARCQHPRAGRHEARQHISAAAQRRAEARVKLASRYPSGKQFSSLSCHM